MQKFVQTPQTISSPGRRRGSPFRALSLWAALFGLGTALGCGAEAGPIDNAGSVQGSLTPMCVTETQGGPTSCKDEKTWSSYAAMSCAGKGLTLSKIGYSDGCGAGLYRQTTYDCCTTTTPPTPMCMWSPAAGTGKCMMPDEWKKEGVTFCAAHGLTLNDLKLDRACMTGGYGTAQFECCTPPTPPPTTMCTAQGLKSMTCVADTAWKTQAEAACKAKGQTLGMISLGTACMGGHLDVKFECCGPTTPPPPPPPTMCSGEAMASMTCVDDGTWKTRAEAACKAKGQTVGTISVGTACMGGHLDIKFECCGPPTPPPPPTGCLTETLASMSCVDDGTWKLKADAACTARKLTLRSIAFGAACMGGHQDIKFECCDVAVPPPPPPPMCSTETLSERSCLADTTWKTRAEAVCKAKMQTVGTLAFGTACMGGHLDIKFECCGPTTPPPPPPPPMCIEENLTEMACIDDVTWKTRADAACKAKKLTLTALAYGTACMGGHQNIKYECCAITTPPPTPMCTTDKVPSPAACQTPDRWKVQGEAYCAAKHLGLSGLTLSGACTGGFSEGQFTCCPVPTPTPICTAGVLGDMKLCQSEASLKTQAEAICKMAGATLTGFGAYDMCTPMSATYLHAKYQCCK